ncbi:RusA family crossover junction endodeoxyribonuclease [Lactobacillus kimbladii]|uniref:RusA family crossover junction endodeoxyribonuclease n=1 Tax=Lactobacillus kimbladii TaxID=1218506 RepID=UPI00164F2827|nr:RusA family crossover junction endodeoxyribonuclease [Lactobacillus kimbladii]MBC6342104.1 RusA family crossover junction endodeoxyribonuclease [Lactobacillus kimbladii]
MQQDKANYHSLVFGVLGDPQGKQRPRFARRGKLVSTYTPSATQKYEEQVRYSALAVRQKNGITKPISTDISLAIRAYFKIPKTYSKKRKERCLNGEERPSKKPDSDNIAKIVLDGLNPKMKVDHVQHKAVCVHEGLYRDDKQVVSLKVDKYYSDKPRVEITAMWSDQGG